MSQTHLDLYSGYRKRFLSPQGIVAIKHDFNDKEGRGDDDELTVYGVNSGTSEIIFNTSQFSLDFFEKWEVENGKSVKPFGIAADYDGWIAVSDCEQDRIIYLQNESNKLFYVRAFEFEETGKPLDSPLGLSIENHRLYIVDSGNDRLVLTNRNGEFLGTIGTKEEQWRLSKPFDVAVIEDPDWNHYSSKFIVVTDSLNQRLCILSMDGSPLACKRFGEISGGSGGFFFVAVDYYSNVYATDTLSGCVYKFDRFLNYLTRFGCGKGIQDPLDEPRGITIYRRFGQVFIAERAGASYFWIGADVLNLSCQARIGEGKAILEIRFLLTEYAHVSMFLEDDAGKTLSCFEEDKFFMPGNKTRIYHLEEDSIPESLAKCNYFISVSATPTYSSKKYHTVKKRAPVNKK